MILRTPLLHLVSFLLGRHYYYYYDGFATTLLSMLDGKSELKFLSPAYMKEERKNPCN